MTLAQRIKPFIPLPMRRSLKWGLAALHDLRDPISAPRIPARRQTKIGGGDFVKVGQSIHQRLIDHGLTSDMTVLEPGCGQARIARPMVGWLQPEEGGRYIGFDIDAKMIAWCQREYDGVEGFEFHHIDAANPLYNRGGDVRGDDVRFPADDGDVDFVFMTSVFTHVREDTVRQYLKETARVLRPGGRSLITWFMAEPDQTIDTMGISHPIGPRSHTTVPGLAEAAISHDRSLIEEAYAEAGLTIIEIERGHWAGGPAGHNLQDIIIADRPL